MGQWVTRHLQQLGQQFEFLTLPASKISNVGEWIEEDENEESEVTTQKC